MTVPSISKAYNLTLGAFQPSPGIFLREFLPTVPASARDKPTQTAACGDSQRAMTTLTVQDARPPACKRATCR